MPEPIDAETARKVGASGQDFETLDPDSYRFTRAKQLVLRQRPENRWKGISPRVYTLEEIKNLGLDYWRRRVDDDPSCWELKFFTELRGDGELEAVSGDVGSGRTHASADL